MKLMGPTQAQAESRSQRALQGARIRENSDALSSIQQRIAQSESDFQKMLESQQERWAQEEKDHEEEIQSRNEEIDKLEGERVRILNEKLKLAATPTQRKEYEGLIAAGRKVIEEYENKKEAVAAIEAQYDKKMEWISEERQRLSDMENGLQERTMSVEVREAGVRSGTKELSESFERLRIEQGGLEKQIHDMNRDFDLRRFSLNDREKELDAREEHLDEREQRIIVLEAMYNSPINESPIRHG